VLQFQSKNLKTLLNLARFHYLNAQKRAFFAFFGAKYAFFEAFLGVKNTKNRVLSADFVSETV
jgi:hypothetical protein